MKKIFAVSLLVISSSLFTLCNAQYVRPGDQSSTLPGHPTQLPNSGFADHLSIGGAFALQFGDYTFIELEPLLSYHFNQNFMIGAGPIYQYESVLAQVYGYTYSASTYGGRIAALYFLPEDFSNVFIMGECDALNVPEPSLYGYQIERGYISLPMLGIGYKERVSNKVFFCIYGLWNFNNSLYNPFTNPIINVGVDVGLWH